jgi:hypothetical protein
MSMLVSPSAHLNVNFCKHLSVAILKICVYLSLLVTIINLLSAEKSTEVMGAVGPFNSSTPLFGALLSIDLKSFARECMRTTQSAPPVANKELSSDRQQQLRQESLVAKSACSMKN